MVREIESAAECFLGVITEKDRQVIENAFVEALENHSVALFYDDGVIYKISACEQPGQVSALKAIYQKAKQWRHPYIIIPSGFIPTCDTWENDIVKLISWWDEFTENTGGDL